MQYRIIDMETGEEVVLKQDHRFVLNKDGSLGELFYDEHYRIYTKPHILEFAFAKDSEGNWIYSHSVVRDNF